MNTLKKFAAVLALAISPAISWAQMEVGMMGIYQNGKEVGRIYVPPRSSRDDTYVEHWVLYPAYVYPGKKQSGLETVIIPLDETVASLAEFRKSLALEPGSRVIEVLSHESVIK